MIGESYEKTSESEATMLLTVSANDSACELPGALVHFVAVAVCQTVVAQAVSPSLPVGDMWVGAKFEPYTKMSVLPDIGPLWTLYVEMIGASNVNVDRSVPVTAATMTVDETPVPPPADVEHLTDVTDVQPVVMHMLVPSRVEGVRSV